MRCNIIVGWQQRVAESLCHDTVHHCHDRPHRVLTLRMWQRSEALEHSYGCHSAHAYILSSTQTYLHTAMCSYTLQDEVAHVGDTNTRGTVPMELDVGVTIIGRVGVAVQFTTSNHSVFRSLVHRYYTDEWHGEPGTLYYIITCATRCHQ